MPLRYTCDEPGLEDNWLEVAEAWTARERREFMATDSDEAVLAWAQRKIGACHIATAPGGVLATGADLTLDNLDDVDLRLHAFIGRALIEAIAALGNLGNASARLSSNGRVRTTTPIAAPQ